MIFLIPTWDLPYGLYRFTKYVREYGGLHVHRTVEAEGYLDLTHWASIGNSSTGDDDVMAVIGKLIEARNNSLSGAPAPYSYIEIWQPLPRSADAIIVRAGYWQLSNAPSGDPSCDAFETWKARGSRRAISAASYLQRRQGYSGWCPVAVWHDKPVSRYRLEDHHSGYPVRPNVGRMPGPTWLPPVLARWSRIVDIQTGEVIARNHSFYYESWFPMPYLDEARPLSWQWPLKYAVPYYLNVRDVIKPTSKAQQSDRTIEANVDSTPEESAPTPKSKSH